MALGPLALSTIIGVLGPQIFGRLFRGGGERELREAINRLFLPGNLSQITNEFQDQWYRSPAYGTAQTAAMAAGRQAEAAVGRAGAGVTSGTDILRGAAAAGLTSGTLSQINAAAYERSRQMALDRARALASGMLGVGPIPSISRQMFGASLGFLGPIYADWIRKKLQLPAARTENSNRRAAAFYDPAVEGNL